MLLTSSTRRSPRTRTTPRPMSGSPTVTISCANTRLMPASEAYPLAKEAAEHALATERRPRRSAHGARLRRVLLDARHTEGEARVRPRRWSSIRRSVRAHHWYATALLHMGEFHHALQEINEAQKLDPQSRSIIADKGLILFYDGKVDDAVGLLGDLAQTERDYLSPFAYLAAIYFAERRYPDFFGAGKEAARLMQDNNRLIAVEAAERGYASERRTGDVPSHGRRAAAALFSRQRVRLAPGADLQRGWATTRRRFDIFAPRSTATRNTSWRSASSRPSSRYTAWPSSGRWSARSACRRFERRLRAKEKRAARGGSRELQGGVKQSGQEPLASIAGQTH